MSSKAKYFAYDKGHSFLLKEEHLVGILDVKAAHGSERNIGTPDPTRKKSFFGKSPRFPRKSPRISKAKTSNWKKTPACAYLHTSHARRATAPKNRRQIWLLRVFLMLSFCDRVGSVKSVNFREF